MDKIREMHKMRKLHMRLAGIVIIAVLALSVFSGCGSNKAAETSTASVPQYANGGSAVFKSAASSIKESAADEFVAAEGIAVDKAAKYETGDSIGGIGFSVSDASNAILAERKIIRSANLSVEVEDFDKAMNDINSIILGIGIIQSSTVRADRVYEGKEIKLVRSGTIVLRVDKNKFESIIGKIKDIGQVYEESINGEDVTEKYFDIESRLRLLRLEQTKLESYIEKLDDLEEIFKAESKLTDIRYEIETLTGNLNKLNSLVELSTITVNMNEKRPGEDRIPPTYGRKLLERLKSSLANVVEFFGDLLIFIISAIPVLIILGLVFMLGLTIYRRIPKKRREPYYAGKSEKGPDGADNKTE